METISFIVSDILEPIMDIDMPVIGLPYGVFVLGCVGVLLLVRLISKVV